MTDIKAPTWADVLRIRDELKVKMHLASQEAKDRWAKLQPSLHEAEEKIKAGGTVVASKIVELAGGLKDIGKDVASKLDKLTHDKDKPKDETPPKA